MKFTLSEWSIELVCVPRGQLRIIRVCLCLCASCTMNANFMVDGSYWSLIENHGTVYENTLDVCWICERDTVSRTMQRAIYKLWFIDYETKRRSYFLTNLMNILLVPPSKRMYVNLKKNVTIPPPLPQISKIDAPDLERFEKTENEKSVCIRMDGACFVSVSRNSDERYGHKLNLYRVYRGGETWRPTPSGVQTTTEGPGSQWTL